ncbi:threonine/serine exporter family protein [Lacticaseibacillus saniviri]|uniref:Threonine Serine Exporter n=1 Tax=Lacticaseibacillus saniviri JCM 17471 = DSM 24301 TaxID=1293598 RepID=A0A0R2MZP3_9LACO|nr:threonine/serine exporter family protein [Lacticaseibacillus saniviri]KRO18852.1 threonine Serine Exporter [Lacticaseibacillus saniviri JCM 17471 = DSM 24301]MCG4281429.1 threonine/serine exporter family protein [Lacticaseibacillus saniviri]
MAYSVQFLIQLSFSYLATVAFAICINVPRRALNFAGWAGAIGWICYWLLNTHGTGRMFANLIGAVAVGVCGIIFARIKKMPVIIFNIPGLVPLVPGATAYQAVRALALGNMDLAIQLGVRVIMVAGAIAVGFMVSQLLSELTYRLH